MYLTSFGFNKFLLPQSYLFLNGGIVSLNKPKHHNRLNNFPEQIDPIKMNNYKTKAVFEQPHTLEVEQANPYLDNLSC